MESNSRGTKPIQYKVGEDMRTAGPSHDGRAQARRDHALRLIQSGWQRRAGATGVLLTVIALTIVLGR